MSACVECVETYCAVLLFGTHAVKYQLFLHNYLHLEVAAVTFTHAWVRAKKKDINMGTKRYVKDEVKYWCALLVCWVLPAME